MTQTAALEHKAKHAHTHTHTRTLDLGHILSCRAAMGEVHCGIPSRWIWVWRMTFSETPRGRFSICVFLMEFSSIATQVRFHFKVCNLPSRPELPGNVPARFYQRCICRDLCGLGTGRHPTMHFNLASDRKDKKCKLQRADLQVRTQNDSVFLCSVCTSPNLL